MAATRERTQATYRCAIPVPFTLGSVGSYRSATVTHVTLTCIDPLGVGQHEW
jgi:hypothetical protein